MDCDNDDMASVDNDAHNSMLSNIFSSTGIKKSGSSTRTYNDDVVVVDHANAQGLMSLKEGRYKIHANRARKLARRAHVLSAPDEFTEAAVSRKAGYEATRSTVNRWKDIVERNRLTDQLVFPLEQANFLWANSEENKRLREEACVTDALKQAVTSGVAVTKETPREEDGAVKTVSSAEEVGVDGSVGGAKKLSLASKLYAVLYPDKLERVAKSLAGTLIPPEELAASELAEEATAVNDQVRERARLRARQSYLESRLKQKAKIKSKNYHRHLKRRKLKIYEKETEELKTSNPAEFAERMLSVERLRAEERASQRHKVGGKFAKAQRLRAKFDGDAREAVHAMLEKSRELTRKTGARIGDASDSESDTKSSCPSDVEDEEAHQTSGNEEGSPLQLKDWEKQDTLGAQQSVQTKPNDAAVKPKPVVYSVINQLAMDSMLGDDAQASGEPGMGSSLDPGEASFFRRLEAACGQETDQLQDDFATEKAAVEAEETPADIDLFVPGWNSWTGPGLEAKDAQRRDRWIKKAPTVTRKDAGKKRVIIRSRVNTEMKKHLVKSIPFPYQTPDQFEAAICKPICREWNTESSFHNLIKPRTIIKSGKIIKPIDRNAALISTKHLARIDKIT